MRSRQCLVCGSLDPYKPWKKKGGIRQVGVGHVSPASPTGREGDEVNSHGVAHEYCRKGGGTETGGEVYRVGPMDSPRN